MTTEQLTDPNTSAGVQAAPGQVAHPWHVLNSAGTELVWVDAAGNLSAAVPGATGSPGAPGANGITPSYLGSFSSAPSSPSLLNWYYDTTLKQAMVCTNATGPVWSIMAKDGAAGSSGTGLAWQGSFASAPSSPSLNWAYYDTTLLQSFIWNGTSWNVICKDGATGSNGSGGCPSADTTIVYFFGSTYYACDGRSGTTLSSNASANTVLQAALTSVASGGALHLGAGLYSGISGILQIPANVKVSGAGYSTIVQKAKNSGTNSHVWMFTDVSNSSLTDMQVDGNYYNVGDQTNSMHGVVVQGSTNIHLERLYVHNAYWDGIYVGWNTDCSTDVYVVDCLGYNCHRNGIAFTGGQNINFIRCKTTQSGNCGFDIEANNTTVTFMDVTFQSCESNNELGGFTGTGQGGQGWYIASGYNSAVWGNIKILHCKAHGNTVGSGATGFDLTNDTAAGGNLNVIVDGGESYGNWSGLELHGNQQNIIIKGLRCYSNLHTGMYLYNDSTSYVKKNIIVDDCIVYSNGGKGIYVDGISGGVIDGVLIKGCIAYSNGDTGIYTGNYTTNSSILGCRSYSNTTSQYNYGTGVTQANNL